MKKIIFALFIFLLFLFAGCANIGNNKDGNGTSKISSPINAKLEILGLKGNEAELLFEFESSFDEKEMDVNITLPKGAEIVSGNLKQTYTDVAAKSKTEHKVTVAFKGEGNYSITGWARGKQSPSYYYGNKDEVCFAVKNGNAREIDCKELLPKQIGTRLPAVQANGSQTLFLTDPFHGTFEGSDEPKLDSRMKILFSFVPDRDFDEINATFYLLYNDASLLKGDTQWSGSAVKGQKIELPIEIYVGASKCKGNVHARVSGRSYGDAAIIERSYFYEVTPPSSPKECYIAEEGILAEETNSSNPE